MEPQSFPFVEKPNEEGLQMAIASLKDQVQFILKLFFCIVEVFLLSFF